MNISLAIRYDSNYFENITNFSLKAKREREKWDNSGTDGPVTSLFVEIFNYESLFYVFFYTKIDFMNIDLIDWNRFSGTKASGFRNGII